MNQAAATREVFWNINDAWLMYLLFIISAGIAITGFYRRVSLWRHGQPEACFDRPGERFRRVLKEALAQHRVLQDRHAGFYHFLIYSGFIILTIATIVVLIDYDLGIHIMRGPFYLYFQSLIVDCFGVLVMAGILLAAIRRFIARPRTLVYNAESTGILVAIFAIAFTGFLIEGWRIAATNDPWGAWSPGGYLVARVSANLMGAAALRSAHAAIWWTHAVMVFGLIAWAPYTKLSHVLLGPLNIYAAPLVPMGASLAPIDFEKAQAFGVNSLAGFTWKDLADLDSCTECGRCSAVCPANTVGKSLSPRDIILGLRDLMHSGSPTLFGNGLNAASSTADKENKAFPIIGAIPATSPDALWACTTCGACMEACPVFIEQMPKIVDMRRHLVMEEAELPDTMQDALSSMESRGHPFRGTQATRLDWTEGLDVPMAADIKDAELIFWVGCGGALIERNQKVTRATATLLQKAGVKFAILGREEKCTGDPARRIGNEFLFQQLVQENTATLNRHNVKKIVTHCPHCFNTFRNEYPQYGGTFEVYHHSEYLAMLTESGRLAPAKPSERKIVFHDPCYLGRHNGVFDPPRQLIKLSSRNAAAELKQSKGESFCCGGGGGMSFIEEAKDQRVNQERARQLLETGADTVAVGCPFCMTMLEDGINARKGDRSVKVMDVAELLLEAMQD
jgi:Fe-S oxidoreductase